MEGGRVDEKGTVVKWRGGKGALGNSEEGSVTEECSGA